MPEFEPVEWITTKQAAEMTGYDYAHIRRLVREERVRGIKMGRDWLVHRDSLQSYFDEMQRLGSAKHNPQRKQQPEDENETS